MEGNLIKLELPSQSESAAHQNDNKKKFICDWCGLVLFSRSGIHRHMFHKHLGLETTAGGGAQLKTDICNICSTYTTKRNFKYHVDSHSTTKNFKCEFCGSAVKSIFTLRKHIKRVHKYEKMESSGTSSLQADISECSTCKKQFASSDELQMHEMRHHSDRLEMKFHCELCDRRFAKHDFLKNHLIKHKAEWSYECGMCSKTFKHSSSVSGHRKTHKVNGFYHCGCCDGRFSDYGQLKHHFDNTMHSF